MTKHTPSLGNGVAANDELVLVLVIVIKRR